MTKYLTEKHKRKISIAMKGKKNSLGFHHSKETKIKMSLSKIGNTYGFKKGHIISDGLKEKNRERMLGENNIAKKSEIRKKISEKNKGRKITEKHKIRIGNATKKRFLDGKIFGFKKVWKENPNFSKKENSPRWIKDRTKLAKKQERNDMAYQEWRKNVWIRDNYKCKMNNENCSGKIIAHHILQWSKFPELRYEVNNGITLCHFHHPRKRNDEIRLSPFFQEMVLTNL